VRIGGFDTSFRGYGGEDFEIGYRLQQAGVQFVSDRNAKALHYHRTTVKGVLRATRQEAPGDKLIGHKHPELRQGLRLMNIPEGRGSLLPRIGFFAPKLGDPLVFLLKQLLLPLERTKLRWLWLILFDQLRTYAYWRGVRDTFGSWGELVAYQMDAQEPPEMTLDISEGLPEALPLLWVDGPSRLTVTMRGQTLGTLEFGKPISVPLRPYLTELIINRFSIKILNILAEHAHAPWEKPVPVKDFLSFTELGLPTGEREKVTP
jgi:hypothetical protein